MNTMNILIIIAVVVVIILLFEFLRQVHNIRNGRNNVSSGRVFLNRFLVLVLLVSLVGMGVSAYADHHQAKTEEATPAPAKTVSNSTQDDQIMLDFNNKVSLNDNNEAKVKIKVSPDTKVVIRGKRTDTKYAEFKSSKSDGTFTKTVTLDYSGDYKVIATCGDKKVVKHLTVEDSDSDSSSSSSSESSSSSSGSASSHSSSTNSTSSHSSNNNSSSTNNSTGSSNSSNRAQSSNAGGNYYRPSRPASSSNYRPSAPAQQPNYSVNTTVGE